MAGLGAKSGFVWHPGGERVLRAVPGHVHYVIQVQHHPHVHLRHFQHLHGRANRTPGTVPSTHIPQVWAGVVTLPVEAQKQFNTCFAKIELSFKKER